MYISIHTFFLCPTKTKVHENREFAMFPTIYSGSRTVIGIKEY